MSTYNMKSRIKEEYKTFIGFVDLTFPFWFITGIVMFISLTVHIVDYGFTDQKVGHGFIDSKQIHIGAKGIKYCNLVIQQDIFTYITNISNSKLNEKYNYTIDCSDYNKYSNYQKIDYKYRIGRFTSNVRIDSINL